MALGLVGRKVGMTRIFTEEGNSVPVSVVEVLPNRVTQIKTQATDGYDAIQVTMGAGLKKVSRLTKPLAGHYAKANVEPGLGLWEFALEATESAKYQLGAELTLQLFDAISTVDVVGVSKGKGFAGVIKRHNFSAQDSTHGNSLSHRAPGSIGQRQSPGKVFKGKRMAGQLGNKRVTTQSLSLVKIDPEKNLLMIQGAVPGAPGSHVVIYPAKKVNPSQHKKERGKS